MQVQGQPGQLKGLKKISMEKNELNIWGMMSCHKGIAYLAMSTSPVFRGVTTLGVGGEVTVVPKMRSTIETQRDLRQETKSDTLK